MNESIPNRCVKNANDAIPLERRKVGEIWTGFPSSGDLILRISGAKYRVSQEFHACQLRCLIVSFIFDRFINASYILSFVRILYLRIPFFLFLIHAEYWPISSKISSFARISRVSILLSHRFFHFRSLYQCFLHSFVRRTCFFRKLSLFTPNIGR